MNYKTLHFQIQHIKEKLNKVNSEKKAIKNMCLKMKKKRMKLSNRYWE